MQGVQSASIKLHVLVNVGKVALRAQTIDFLFKLICTQTPKNETHYDSPYVSHAMLCENNPTTK